MRVPAAALRTDDTAGAQDTPGRHPFEWRQAVTASPTPASPSPDSPNPALAAAAALPRLLLATLPTPLVEATRLTHALGGPPIFVKRDDLAGFGLVGHKSRQLEFLVGDALEQGCDVMVTGGGRRGP